MERNYILKDLHTACKSHSCHIVHWKDLSDVAAPRYNSMAYGITSCGIWMQADASLYKYINQVSHLLCPNRNYDKTNGYPYGCTTETTLILLCT